MEPRSHDRDDRPARARTSRVLPRIHAAATELFGAQGVMGTTTREIAMKAGVAEGALYRHYRSKEHLARQLLEHHQGEIEAGLRLAVASSDSMADRMHALVLEFLARCETDRSAFRMAMLSPEAHTLAHSQRGLIPVLLDLLRSGVESGELVQESIELEAAIISGMLLGVTGQRQSGEISGDLRAHAPYVTMACLRAVGAGAPSVQH